jgi:hypothetical protein
VNGVGSGLFRALDGERLLLIKFDLTIEAGHQTPRFDISKDKNSDKCIKKHFTFKRSRSIDLQKKKKVDSRVL